MYILSLSLNSELINNRNLLGMPSPCGVMERLRNETTSARTVETPGAGNRNGKEAGATDSISPRKVDKYALGLLRSVRATGGFAKAKCRSTRPAGIGRSGTEANKPSQ